jgi:thiamine-phosphate pyrophosphorylase
VTALPVGCPPLYAVLDVDLCARHGRDAVSVAAAFLAAGVSLLQIRGKSLGAADLLRLTREVMALGPDARVIVNDRPDVARLAEAGGVHVGQDDLSVADARTIVGPELWVGLSTHTTEQVRTALDQSVNYIAVGPVFDTGTKDTGYAAVGLDLVRQAVLLATPRAIPVVAIGGITLDQAPGVLAAGASAVCVISDLLRGDPGQRARAFVTTLDPKLRGL